MCLFCKTSTSVHLRYNRPPLATIAEQLAGAADVILHGGPILTMDTGKPEAAAIAVRQGLVQAVGSLDDAMRHKGRITRMLDLGGRALLPGFVLADLPKDPVDFLDWQSIGAWPERDDDLSAFLARNVMPSIFAEPVFVNVTGAGQPPSACSPLLDALARLCGEAPMAVRMPGATAGFANDAMLRLAPDPGRSIAIQQTGGFTPVGDMPAMLRPLAAAEEHSASSVARALDAKIRAASLYGFTTVVDRRMGSVAGRREIDAATAILGRSRGVRVHAAAHERLRQEWDGTLPEGLPPGRLCVDDALVSIDRPAPQLLREVQALHKAGWRIAFDVRDEDELDVAIQLCSLLTRDKAQALVRYRIEAAFAPDARQAGAIDAQGISLSIEPKEEGAGDCSDGRPIHKSPSPSQRLSSLTLDAARRRGIESVAGMIKVGRHADFTVLERLPFEMEAIQLNCTWVDGAPVL